MILAIQTDTPVTKLWLSAAPDQASPDVIWESGRGLADGLLGQIVQLAHAKGVSLTAQPDGEAASDKLARLTGIVVFAGPGSFTGLRIGHTTANALADGLNIPVVNAQGDNWLGEGIKTLASAQLGRPALPHYGSQANITKPKGH